LDQPGQHCSQHGDFSPDRRLRTPGEFRRVQETGRRFDLGTLTARALPRRGTPPLPGRLGLAISRRAGGAVQRNRIKRLVRDAFRRKAAAFDGLDIVFTARPEAAAHGQPQVDQLIDRLAQLVAGGVTPAPPRPPRRPHKGRGRADALAGGAA